MKDYTIVRFKKFKLNYWPIPKCANTAVRAALISPNPDKLSDPGKKQKWVYKTENSFHITYDESQKNNFLNFTVTRHPYERIISLYKDQGLRRPIKIFNNYKNLTFDKFLNIFLDIWPDDSVEQDPHFLSMSYYITDNTKILVDKVVNIKDLDVFLASRTITPRRVNVTQPLNIKLTDKQKEKIYQRYKKDFDILKYKK